jgi:hypothetical protein
MALEPWEIKIGNTEVTPEAMAHYEIPPTEGWTKGTNCYSWCSCLKFHPPEKGKAIAYCLDIQFTLHDLCDEKMNGGWRLELKLCSKQG